MEVLRDISGKVVDEYKKNLTNKLRLVDALILFSFFTGVIQVTPILAYTLQLAATYTGRL